MGKIHTILSMYEDSVINPTIRIYHNLLSKYDFRFNADVFTQDTSADQKCRSGAGESLYALTLGKDIRRERAQAAG